MRLSEVDTCCTGSMQAPKETTIRERLERLAKAVNETNWAIGCIEERMFGNYAVEKCEENPTPFDIDGILQYLIDIAEGSMKKANYIKEKL